MKNIYLPGLNALRAIAALVVVVFHFDISFSTELKITSFSIYSDNTQAALAVTLFFVLSGYLITFLLFEERQKRGQIDIKAFYIRRILRIWPLYLLIILCTAALNYALFQESIFKTNPSASYLYLFFLGNFVEPFVGLFSAPNSIITPLFVLWSVGVEEQFYLIWPWLIRHSKKILVVLVSFVITFLCAKLFAQLYLGPQYLNFLNLTRLDCMAIGAIGAFVIKSKNKKIGIFLNTVIYSPVIQIVCWALFLSAFTLPIHLFSFIDHELYSIAFIVVILNVSMNSKSMVRLENKVFNFLGQISYGIYMYHTLIMVILVKIVGQLDNSLVSYFSWLAIVLFIVIAIAYLSNKFFEGYFIRLKRRFEIVNSTNKKANDTNIAVERA
ncbi:MAG TPA: acyltransferase [Flavisolibacter sp.]|nr:acyltransferase [Flavisolibacter sp.]